MNFFRHGNEVSGNLIHFRTMTPGPSRTAAGPSTKQTCWRSCFRPRSGPTRNSEPMRPALGPCVSKLRYRKLQALVRAGLDPKNLAKWHCSVFHCYLSNIVQSWSN
jgi:hypothetical protein